MHPESIKKIAGIILAVGKGIRMKKEIKQLLLVKGKPMLQYLFDTIKKSNLEQIIIVLGYKKNHIIQKTNFKGGMIIENRNFDMGQSSSLKLVFMLFRKIMTEQYLYSETSLI